MLRDQNRCHLLSFSVVTQMSRRWGRHDPIIFQETLAYTDPPARLTVDRSFQVLLTSCSRCQACDSLVYDEEIMAGWSSDDSNLNTTCPFCGRPLVPFLSIEIQDFQAVALSVTDGSDTSSVSSDWPRDGEAPVPGGLGPVLSDRHHCLALDETEPELARESRDGSLCNGFTESPAPQAPTPHIEHLAFAYLSPLVLRKELETLLENEGGEFLSQPELVNNHPIIYWNLVWYFQRLGLPSGLPQLLLASKHIQTPRQGTAQEGPLVSLHLLWDVLSPDPDSFPPLYVLWRFHSNIPTRLQSWRRHNHPFSLSFLEAMMSSVGVGEVHKAIALFLDTVTGQPNPIHLQRSIYREILFLKLAALGRDHVDIADFDKKYKSAYAKLAHSLGKESLKQQRAQPLTSKAIDCRKSFGANLQC